MFHETKKQQKETICYKIASFYLQKQSFPYFDISVTALALTTDASFNAT